MIEPIANAGGAMPWFDFGGEGRPIVLLHGGVRTHGDWADCVPALVARHRVVAVDLRGHGASTVDEFDLDAAVADVNQLIDELTLDRPVLVGHSLGGLVAATYAVRPDAPTRIAGVVNVDAVGVSVPDVFPEPHAEHHRHQVLRRVAAMADRSGGAEPDASIAREIAGVDIFDLTRRTSVPTLVVLATRRPELVALDNLDPDDDRPDLLLGHWRQAQHEAFREIAKHVSGVTVEPVASSHLIAKRQPERLTELILAFADALDD